MKLTALLEDQDHEQKLRKSALELQSHLVDLKHMDLEVELLNRAGAIVLEYHDENHLVRGNVHLSVKYTPQGVIYRAQASGGVGVIQTSRDGFAVGMILLRIFQEDAPFKAFEQSLMSDFGTTAVQSIDKARLPDDEVYGAAIMPPFTLQGRGLRPIMVHNQQIVQVLDVCITSESKVRIHLHDAQGDEHTFEEKSVLDILPKLRDVFERD